MSREAKDVNLNARVTKNEKTSFIEKASRYGNPSEVLRELVNAFIEDRLEIKPPSPSKKELLYVPRIED